MPRPWFRRSFVPRMEHLEDRTLLNAGVLDTTFGTGGKVLTSFSGFAVSGGIAVQTDGKIVVVGSASGNFAVARYNSDGTLDSTFGTSGQVTTDFGNVDSATDVVIQPDGKLLVVGNSTSPDLVFDTAIARYLPNGQLDAGFGNGGKIIESGFIAERVALYPDGRFLVEANSGSFLTTIHALTISRFSANGTPDPSFGNNGTASVFFSASGTPAPNGVFILPDGRILATGVGGVGALLARLNADGSLDTSFGTQGQVSTADVSPSGAALQSDGKIVLSGTALGAGHGAFAAVRFNVNGTLDATFGSGGMALLDFGQQAQASSVAVQADGRIVVAGTVQTPDGDFAIVRLTPNGSLDTPFGSAGETVTDFGPLNEIANRIVLQSDGKAVLTGGASGQFALARYTSDGPVGNLNQQYVTQLYLDLLQRTVDPSGFAYWSTQLALGTSRAQVALALEVSSEFRSVVVEQLYGQYLHRAADPTGLNNFVAFLGTGGTAEQVATALVGSQEYFQLHGGSNDGFLTALYADALNRTIDAGGSTALHGALIVGASRAQVAAAVLGSPEYQQGVVAFLYEHFLRRTPEATGLSGFVLALQSGARDENVAAVIAGSDEYLGRL